MAVDDPHVVDILSIHRAGEAVLTVSDHLDWTETVLHQAALQVKLNRYLAFAESGEMIETYPEAEGRPVVFRIVLLFAPDSEGASFLERAGEAVERAGFAFT